ncbi:hypothetical protein HDU76_008448, partial [Blyttiomyces sp. JEL0837]
MLDKKIPESLAATDVSIYGESEAGEDRKSLTSQLTEVANRRDSLTAQKTLESLSNLTLQSQRTSEANQRKSLSIADKIDKLHSQNDYVQSVHERAREIDQEKEQLAKELWNENETRLNEASQRRSLIFADKVDKMRGIVDEQVDQTLHRASQIDSKNKLSVYESISSTDLKSDEANWRKG